MQQAQDKSGGRSSLFPASPRGKAACLVLVMLALSPAACAQGAKNNNSKAVGKIASQSPASTSSPVLRGES